MERIIKIIIVGVILGILLSITNMYLKMEPIKLLILFFIVSFIVIFLNFFYYLHYILKMNKIVELCDTNSELYVKELESLKRKIRGNQIDSIINLNLAAGYIEINEFQQALSLLQSIAIKKERKETQLVYFLDYCLCLCHLKRFDEALLMYQERASLFNDYRTKPMQKEYILSLDMLMLIVKGQKEEALKRIKEVLPTCREVRVIRSLNVMESNLEQDNKHVLDKILEEL